MSRRRLLAAEALAYLKSGVYASTGARVHRDPGGAAARGILFVHGVAASPTQFRPVRRALESDCELFDAFGYSSLRPLADTARTLTAHIEGLAGRCDRLVVVGHSLGGVLLRMVLQGDAPPPNVTGFVSICAPLHGTHVGKLAPPSALRQLRPESPLMRELSHGAQRLARPGLAVLTIGARRDAFVKPWDSAFLDGHPTLVLEDRGHVSSLFDPNVHRAIRGVLGRGSS